MTGIYLLQLAAGILIVGGTFRLIELKWPDTMVGRALGVIY